MEDPTRSEERRPVEKQDVMPRHKVDSKTIGIWIGAIVAVVVVVVVIALAR